jgi:hypothetical protein
VEYKNGATLQNVAGQDAHPDWRPLNSELPSLCDASVAPTAAWGNIAGTAALRPEPPLVSTAPTHPVTSTFTQTKAFCASDGNSSKLYFTAFANCPTGFGVYYARISCGAAGYLITGLPTESGLFAVCCGDADRIELGCSRKYEIEPQAHDVTPEEAERKSTKPAMTGDNVHYRLAMFNSYANCKGPNPSLVYNAFGAHAPCPSGTYTRQVVLSCGTEKTRILAFGFNNTAATGGCCASPDGVIDMTCGQARYQLLPISGDSSPRETSAQDPSQGMPQTPSFDPSNPR